MNAFNLFPGKSHRKAAERADQAHQGFIVTEHASVVQLLGEEEATENLLRTLRLRPEADLLDFLNCNYKLYYSHAI